MHNIIIIDDDFDYRQLLCTYLKKVFPDTTVTEYDPIAQGIPGKEFDWTDYDCLILDYYLCIKNFTGLDLLKREQTNPDFPASIVLTGAGNEEIATKSLRFGANKFINKQGLTKGILRESVEEAWQRHQENLYKRKLIERRNRAFNKTRFYQTLEATTQLDLGAVTRCLLSIEITAREQGRDIDLITRNTILKHVAMLCFRFLLIKYPELCITTLTDNSIALIIDFTQQNRIKTTIKELQMEILSNPVTGKNEDYGYNLITTAVLVSEPGTTNEQISSEFKLACKKARSLGNSGKNILIHNIRVQKDIPPPEPPAPAPAAEPGPQTDTEPVKLKETPRAPEVSQPVHGPTDSTSRVNDLESTPEPAPTPEPAEDDDSGIIDDDTVADLHPETAGEEEKPDTSKYEVRFDASKLSEQDKKIIEALEEHRIVQVFQPIIVFNTEIFEPDEIFHVSLRLVDKLGDEESAREMFANGEHPEVSKYIDRWMIKEAVSNVIDTEPGNRNQMFMIKLNHYSLSDTTLFNWLRELLSGIDDFNPGEYIILEISIADFLQHQKQVTALIQYLSRTFGFHFALGHIKNADDIKQVLDLPGIQMLMLTFEIMDALKKITVEENMEGNFVNYLKQKDIYLITRDVDDSTQLMDAIAAGADFAMGEFVGEPQTQLDESTNIESYDLGNRLGSTVF